MHSFSYVRDFPMRFFYTVMSFNEASEDTELPMFFLCCLFLYWQFPFLFLACLPLHLPYEGKCQNDGRPEMTDRSQHVRR